MADNVMTLRRPHEREKDTRVQQKPGPICRSCKRVCVDYNDLAHHISESPRETHKYGRVWAARYLQRHLTNKREFKTNFTPPTEKQLQALENTRRQLSGAQECVTTLCLPGKHATKQYLPIEYTRSRDALRIKGILVVSCNRHKY